MALTDPSVAPADHPRQAEIAEDAAEVQSAHPAEHPERDGAKALPVRQVQPEELRASADADLTRLGPDAEKQPEWAAQEAAPDDPGRQKALPVWAQKEARTQDAEPAAQLALSPPDSAPHSAPHQPVQPV